MSRISTFLEHAAALAIGPQSEVVRRFAEEAREIVRILQIDNERLRNVASNPNACKKCGGSMNSGIAIQQTVTGMPDFPGREAVTLSPGGPGRLVPCLKCLDCGHSVTTAMRLNAKVTGSPALSASPRGLPGYAGDNNGE